MKILKFGSIFLLLLYFYYLINTNINILTKTTSSSLNRQLNKIKDNNRLKVFLIPHSHCDSGWLKTYEEYYYDQVQYILDGFIYELEQDKEKKFIWAEIGFFSMWYNNQNQTKRDSVKKLLNDGQLEFVGGGWVQHDEATTSLDDIVEHMTQGHLWLKDNLNYTVKYGWQIDPFGYSTLTPTLMSNMGFKGLVINRVSHDVKKYMKDHQEMEFLWEGSKSLGLKSEMLVSTLDIHYSYPDMLDPSNHMSASSRVKKFVKYLKQLAKTRSSNTLIIPLGDDFRYSNASKEFAISKEWLALIQEKKEEYNIDFIDYATLSDYFNQLKLDLVENDIQLTHIDEDFFVYNTGSDEHWSGYYTTRPTIKKQIRDVSYLLRVVDTLYSIFQMQFGSTAFSQSQKNQLQLDLDEVRNVVSLTQHHDITTGTSRSYVLYDYFLKLKNARFLSLNIISNLYNILLNNSNYMSDIDLEGGHFDYTTSLTEGLVDTDKENYLFNNFIDLKKLNKNEYYSIKLYNSLGWESNQFISIRLASSEIKELKNLKVYDSSLNEMNIQINSLNYSSSCFNESAQFTLFTTTKVPAFGFTTLLLTVKTDDNNSPNTIYFGEKLSKLESDLVFGNKFYEWKLSKSNGLLKSIKNGKDEIIVTQNFKQYKSKNSGPYIFEAGKMESILSQPNYYVKFEGPLVSQLSIIYGASNCEKLTIVNQRVYKSSNSVESSTLNEHSLETSYSFIGDMNREKVIQYKIDSVKNEDNVYYTDNSLESKKRIINKDGSTSSNYYPTLHFTHLKDETKNQQFTVFVDRSVGSTLKSNNQLEIMLHRTSDNDDSKGISWPSKDTSRIDGKLYFNLDTIDYEEQNQKKMSLQIDNQPFYLIKRISNVNDYLEQFKSSFAPLLSQDLPNNIHLQSIKSIFNSNNNLGLRFVNFNYNKLLSDNKVHLNSYFNDFANFKLNETGLTFLDLVGEDSIDKNIKDNYYIDNTFPIKSGISEYDYSKYQNQNQNQNQIDLNNNIILVKPLEIKSYLFSINSNNNNNKSNFNYKYLYSITDDSLNNNTNIDSIRNSINYIYTYDFSVYPLELSHYNDRGIYPSKLKVILLSTIIPGVALIVLVLSIVIYKKRQQKLKKVKFNYSQEIKFSKIEPSITIEEEI